MRLSATSPPAFNQLMQSRRQRSRLQLTSNATLQRAHRTLPPPDNSSAAEDDILQKRCVRVRVYVCDVGVWVRARVCVCVSARGRRDEREEKGVVCASNERRL